ncbi:alanine racemase [Acidimicrobiia bacterium EGI L10123]|uniref:alanine racemase n=1 Tax=Salinilacustrithrix flava TaxID=2957203 RepID=UPI003D7C254E|nr:alanine racemase [Acidimicrobiia bacterium EGI L10123]
MHVSELQTPALVVDRAVFDRNVTRMAGLHPGRRLRPHVKAFKSTALARHLIDAGHPGFCCATVAEVLGMAGAGLGDDLLLANETLDPRRLRAMAELDVPVTVAVDSDETVDAAAAAGIQRVLVDVEVGLPRCGCAVDDAGRLADRARAAGMQVRGVMGYEGHVNALLDREERRGAVEMAMSLLLRAHDLVGGDVVSGGGTMTAELNEWATEVQAGTYVLMDTSFAPHVPFEIAVGVDATVISVSPKGWAVADAGLKAFGMDSGKPSLPGAEVWIVSDEHVTFAGLDVSVGDRVRLLPAHLDPTVAKHDRMWVLDGDEVVDEWPVDLRGW